MVDNKNLEKKEKTLDQIWKKNQVVLSLGQAQGILQAFKDENLTKGKFRGCLIFNFDKSEYRRVGEQKVSKFIPYGFNIVFLHKNRILQFCKESEVKA